MNNLAPFRLETLEGLHTLEWIKSKGAEVFIDEDGKDKQWCLASSHTSQWKSVLETYRNKERNIALREPKLRWPKHLWWSQILDCLGDLACV